MVFSAKLASIVAEFLESYKIYAEGSLVQYCIKKIKGSQQIQIIVADYLNK